MSAAPVTDGVVEALQAGRPDVHPRQLRQPRHGRPHRQAEAGDQRDRDDRRLHRPDRRRAAAAAKATVFITADHGNCETMIDPETGQPHTAHTTEPDPVHRDRRRSRGAQAARGRAAADVAPTVLDRMGIAQPPEMDGRSLFENGASASGSSTSRASELNSLLDKAARSDEDEERDGGCTGGAGRPAGHVRRRAGGRDRAPAAAREEVEEAVRGGARRPRRHRRARRRAEPPPATTRSARPTRRWRSRPAPTSRPSASRTGV